MFDESSFISKEKPPKAVRWLSPKITDDLKISMILVPTSLNPQFSEQSKLISCMNPSFEKLPLEK